MVGKWKKRWFPGVVHVGRLRRDVVSLVVGNMTGGHSMPKSSRRNYRWTPNATSSASSARLDLPMNGPCLEHLQH